MRISSDSGSGSSEMINIIDVDKSSLRKEKKRLEKQIKREEKLERREIRRQNRIYKAEKKAFKKQEQALQSVRRKGDADGVPNIKPKKITKGDISVGHSASINDILRGETSGGKKSFNRYSNENKRASNNDTSRQASPIKKLQQNPKSKMNKIYEIAGLSILRPEQNSGSGSPSTASAVVKKTIPSPKKRKPNHEVKRSASPPPWDPTKHKYNRYGMLLKPGEVDEEGYADTPQHIIDARRKAAPVREYLARTCHNENIDLLSQADTLASFESSLPRECSLWSNLELLKKWESDVENGEIA